jgi:hypothetical protein
LALAKSVGAKVTAFTVEPSFDIYTVRSVGGTSRPNALVVYRPYRPRHELIARSILLRAVTGSNLLLGGVLGRNLLHDWVGHGLVSRVPIRNDAPRLAIPLLDP